MSHAGDADDELPDELATAAGVQLMAAGRAERAAVFAALLAAHPKHELGLRQLLADLDRVDGVLPPLHLPTGEAGQSLEAVDDYRVIRQLGEGAFGVVYLCRQERPVRREVAVKVLRPGTGSLETSRRFAAERQLLATLSHPTITPIFDAGTLPDGRPYFAMEYVDGPPIRRYCDDEQLTVDERLRLFLELCRGVEHAHRRGIVHRDLKPANVLVVASETGPQPKIIDFGIAKALHGPAADGDVHTEAGRVVGTPGYMSPEQAAGRAVDVDARADVFALGVMLYELLTGELPWGSRPETTDSQPVRPSIRLASDGAAATERATRRRTDPQKLVSRLRGDLDCITLKALEHDRMQRYASAAELAADLERHLRGEAITARPTHLARRATRLLRRHRVAVAAATAALALAFGTWISLHFSAQADAQGAAAVQARQQLASARNQAAQLSGEAETLAQSLLSRADDRGLRALPASAPVRQALAQEALSFYERFLRERPTAPSLREGRARALDTLSRVHRLLGQYEEAIEVASEAVDEVQALLAVDPENSSWRGVLALAHGTRARARNEAGRLDAARDDLRIALAALERCYAEAPQRYATAFVRLLIDYGKAQNRAGEDEAQLAALQRAVAVGEANLGNPVDPEVQGALIDAHGTLVQRLIAMGEHGAAERALERIEQLRGDASDDPRTVSSLHFTRARLASGRGDAAAAIAAARKGIAVAQRWCEQEPMRPATWSMLARLHRLIAGEHSARGEHEAAAAASREAITATRTRVARFPGDPAAVGDLANFLGWHGELLFVTGRRADLAEAEDCAREGVAILAGADQGIDRRLRWRQRCRSLTRLGLVLDARGSSEALAHWETTDAAMREYATEFEVDADDASNFALARLRLGARRLDAGNTTGAGEALAVAEQWLVDFGSAPDMAKNAAAAGRLAAMLAVQRSDLPAAAAAAEHVFAADLGWRGAMAAADGMSAVWRAAAAQRATSAAAYRDRAIAVAESAIAALRAAVAAAPADVWVSVPLCQQEVALAELLLDRGDRERAQQLLATAMPVLAAQRDEVHVDCWDEALFGRGRAMSAPPPSRAADATSPGATTTPRR